LLTTCDMIFLLMYFAVQTENLTPRLD